MKKHRRTVRLALLSAMTAIASAGLAHAQPVRWEFRVSNPILPGQASTTVEAWAHISPTDYAFAGALFGAIADEPGWSNPVIHLPPPGGNPGVILGNAVTGIQGGQIHLPPQIFANPANPILVWSATWSTQDFTPRCVNLRTSTSRFDVYPDRNLPGAQPRIAELTEAAGTISVGGARCDNRHERIIQNMTPNAWFADPVPWVRDTLPFDTVAPLNGVDYLIDISNDPDFDIIVNFRGCLEPNDIAFLLQTAPNGVIQRVGSYITYVAMTGVSKAEARAIAQSPRVAFVERQIEFQTTLDVSVAAMRISASTTYPTTNVATAFPWLDGTGVNIAILDTGVDNHLHSAFALTPFIAGYNVFTSVFGDPDDDNMHGTHVAGIALGQAFTGGSRGVAPRAGLIDIKVLDAGGGGTWLGVTEGVETVYNNRTAWNVGIMNMSLGSSAPSDGTEALCQLIDLADSMGLCVVVSAGNAGPFNPGLGAPASASRAITVGAVNDLNTVTRTDDTMASFSSRGPRASNGNATALDELKPEISAPGTHIVAALYNTTSSTISLSGTSMAAPHIAGLIALMRQAQPDANCALIKTRLIAAATPLASFPASSPSIDPVWNNASGWGSVDGYAAIAITAGVDIKFPSHPASPAWLSPDLSCSPAPKVGLTSTITAMIRNPSSISIPGVRVEFGIHDYTAAVPTFHDIGLKVVTLAPGVNPVTLAWTPTKSGHQCLRVNIGYPSDPDGSNNRADRNLNVANSPVLFEVRNTLTDLPADIEFDVHIHNPGWTVRIDPPRLTLSGADCPVKVTALPIPPFGVANGERARIDIAARIGEQQLDGVTILAKMTDCNDNGIDDWEDIQSGFSRDRNGNGIPDECECYADCDQSTGQGVLDIFDFLCFGNLFSQGDPYACDCDVSTGPNVCDVFDFLCFGNAFAVGCPRIPHTFSELMVAGSDDRTILLFDGYDGSLIDPAFIDGSALGFRRPIQAKRVPAVTGDEIWITDQLADAIHRFRFDDRSHLGAITGELDDLRGMEVHDGTIYVTNFGTDNGAPGSALITFDTDATRTGVFPAGTNPFDVQYFNGQLLVTDINVEDILWFSPAGDSLGVFHDSNGTTGIDFPGQMSRRHNNPNILVAGFSPPAGIYEYAPDGTQVRYIPISGSGPRGVYELGNGDILYTSDDGVFIWRDGVSTQLVSGRHRFISPLRPTPE